MPSDGRGSTISGPVERAFLLLQTVAADREPVGVRELGRRTGLPRSTAARLAAQLVELGMLSRSSEGELSVGPGVASLQPRAGLPEPSLEDRLRPLLLELADHFGESAAITIDTAGGAHYLAQVPGSGAVQVPDSTGASFPFHSVAPGLVLMTAWPESRLADYLARPLEAPTVRTITDAEVIRGRLGEIADCGFAWTDQELDPEANGVAVAVRGVDKGITAAISLYGPAYRLNPVDQPGLASELARIVDSRTAIALA